MIYIQRMRYTGVSIRSIKQFSFVHLCNWQGAYKPQRDVVVVRMEGQNDSQVEVGPSALWCLAAPTYCLNS